MAMQTLSEAEIMNKDLTGLDKMTCKYYQLRRQEIIKDLRAQRDHLIAKINQSRAWPHPIPAQATDEITSISYYLHVSHLFHNL